ncbi:MAG: hypothetical protein E7272_02010 [Pseudobutyrivibrio ruminis]|uniref:Membrane protein 6-pyruvoyl-tetrahydropterin synthase-related domain-containing protein n=1 Tax=Pseudobutyrivibrio ruminis TaxID=46206 RepID=A0A927U5H6_9FIRM|nr:hypothetical protein [Pseudobutyrivibrio ruminis]
MKKKATIILLVELIILLIAAIYLYITAKGNTDIIEIPLDKCYSDYIEMNNGCWSVKAGELAIDEDVNLVITPEMSLKKGFYTIEVEYKSTYGQYVKPTATNGNSVFIKGSKFIVDKNLTHASYTFELTENIDNFRIQYEYNGVGDYSIYAANIHHSNCTERMLWLRLFIVVLIINFLFILFNISPEKRYDIVVITLITILTSLPLFYKGLDGHDIAFHLMRIEGITQELRNGEFPVYVSSAWMGGYGYPTSVFYGDVLLYFPAMLRLFGVNVTSAYKIYVFIVNMATTSLSVTVFNRMFKDIHLARLLALVYVTSSYRLVDIYVRAAAGEYSAAIFFPLIAFAIWKIYKDNSGLKKNIYNGIILAIGMAGIILSHILTTEMILVVLVVFVLINIKYLFNIEVIKAYVFGIAFTILLSIFFVVPFLDYYFNVPVLIRTLAFDNTSSKIQNDGLSLADIFAFFNNPFGSPGYMLCTPGVILVIAWGVGVWLFIKRRANTSIKLLTISSTIILLMTTNIFPWNRLAYNFKAFNILAQVQFPWRYILIVSMLLSVLLGNEIVYLKGREDLNIEMSRLLRGLSIISISMTLLFVSYYSDYANRNMFFDLYNLKTYGVSSGEYLRTSYDNGELHVSESDFFTGTFNTEDKIDITILQRCGKNFDIECRNYNSKVGKVEAPIINYKGYKIYDENGVVIPIEDSDNCLVQFEVPSNYNGIIYIRFIEPWYWKVALYISLSCIFVICCIGLNERRITQRTDNKH